MLTFSKYQGLGNDFILMEGRSGQLFEDIQSPDPEAPVAETLHPARIGRLNLFRQLAGTTLHQDEIVTQPLIFAERQHCLQPSDTNTLQDFED